MTSSAATLRSLEFVPLKISSIRNRTGSALSVERIVSRKRSTSERNLDLPSESESPIDIEAQRRNIDVRRLRARTGAPAEARTEFTPMVRSSVLLPAMLEPLIK